MLKINSFTNNILPYIGLLGLFALPVGFFAGKAVLEIGSALCILSFLLYSAQHKDWRWTTESWVKWSLLIWLYLLLQTGFLHLTDQLYDVEGAWKRSIGFARLILLACSIGFWLLKEDRYRRYFANWFLCIVLFLVIDGIAQFLMGTSLSGHDMPAINRLSGPFQDMVLGYALCHIIWTATAHHWYRVQACSCLPSRLMGILVLLGLPGLTILFSGERMSFLVFAFCVILFGIFAKGLRRELLISYAMGLIILIFAVWQFPVVQQRMLDSSIRDISRGQQSAYGRVFENGINVWQDTPIMGSGLRQFRHACQDLDLPAVNAQSVENTANKCGLHPHNLYIEWLAETGLIGLVMFIVLVALWLRMAIRHISQSSPPQRAVSLSVWLGVLSFIWPLMTTMSFFTNWNAIMFWLVLGVAIAVTQSPNRALISAE